MDVKQQRVDIWANHPEGISWPCPECGVKLSVYDHAPERVWRHLDSCQFKTLLHARIPRINCLTHGVKQVSVPWADARARFTSLFERLAIDVLKESDITGATRILRLSWDEAWHIMERAVQRGKAAKGRPICEKIGVDEKSIAKGHKYLTLVYDLERSTVEYIGDERRKESLDGYFAELSAEQRESIKAVAVDIWDPFLASIREHVSDAEEKIVLDRYHLMTHMVKAVDTVRKQEHGMFKKEGVEVLKGTKYLWLYSRENVPESRLEEFGELKRKKLKTARAWAIKESLRELWHYRLVVWAQKYFQRWYSWAVRSRLLPVANVARMFKKYLKNILTYLKFHITNAVSEGINSKIQTIKKMACGFRNRENFKTAIYFHCGGLQLYPLTHKNV
ncbi:MAG TPA: ISL3 family transposase [Desulfobacterales bacterium]|nr:ISL3 family transposase [Desulfobacterales bacterium]